MSNRNDSNSNSNNTNNSDNTKLEHDIEKFPGRQLSEDEAHQLLRELSKEEMTLKQLIYEFTQELDKTKLEEQMLRNLIAQNGKPSIIHTVDDNHNKQEADVDDGIEEDIDMREVMEPIDGDMQLMDLFKDILNE